jgi:DNA end-binding protein Ku
MPQAIWKGVISFGLVNIPIRLYAGVRQVELRFHLLHAADQGRVRNVRTCEVCGRQVDKDEIVRGYEFEKDQYVILSDEDFERVNLKSTQAIEVVEFVEAGAINPIQFNTPYYLEPDEKADTAYALFREALRESGRVGVARVVLHRREHLAVVKVDGPALVLELLYYADELRRPDEFRLPAEQVKVNAEHRKLARQLIQTLEAEFKPDKYSDSYREALGRLIEDKIQGRPLPKPQKAAPARVLDIMDKLKKSLEQTQKAAGRKRVA